MDWALLIVGLLLVGVLAYWQLIIAEGTYLGPRVVTIMYDWAASFYERIKQFEPQYEQYFLGLPLAQALDEVANPFVLDVGTGTGRLPRALLFQPRFHGRVVGVDLSRRMLKQATRLSRQYAGRLTLIWQDAQTLPFQDDTFDAVTCLEMLEFTPNPRAVLRELVRVLRPGGVLLVTNRIGREARFLPGRAFPHRAFLAVLQSLPLEDVRTQTWQVDYNLAWAVKAGVPVGGGVTPLHKALRCPACGHNQLPMDRDTYRCPDCGRNYPVANDGVIEMASAARAQRQSHQRRQVNQIL